MKKVISYIEEIKDKKINKNIEYFIPKELPDIISYQSKKIEEITNKIPTEIIVNQALINKSKPFKWVPRGFDPLLFHGSIVVGSICLLGALIGTGTATALGTIFSLAALPYLAGIALVSAPFIYWAIKYYQARKANIARIQQTKIRLAKDPEMPAEKFYARREFLFGLKKQIKHVSEEELARLKNIDDDYVKKIKVNDLKKQTSKSLKYINNELNGMFILVDKLYNDINRISSEQREYLEQIFGKRIILKKIVLAKLEEEKDLSLGKVTEYIEEKLINDKDIDSFRQIINKLLFQPRELSTKEYNLLISLLDKKFVDGKIKANQSTENELNIAKKLVATAEKKEAEQKLKADKV